MAWDARERLLAIFGKHRDHNICYNIKFRLIRCCQVNKDVPGVDCYLAMLRVYNGRKGKHTIFLVINDWVDRRVADNGQVF